MHKQEHFRRRAREVWKVVGLRGGNGGAGGYEERSRQDQAMVLHSTALRSFLAIPNVGLAQGGFAVEAGGGACFLFDAQELIVFGGAVGAAGGAGLDLASGGGDGEIGDEGVFSFTGAGGNDGGVGRLAGELHGGE